ncbi:MAG: hypothetical protein Q9182_004403 [Xanthomendoza sp. 2 TL-2023]
MSFIGQGAVSLSNALIRHRERHKMEKININWSDDVSQTPREQPPDRSQVTSDGGAARYDNAFDVNEKVWMKNPAKDTFEWHMTVVEARYDKDKLSWEYKVKDTKGTLYKEGTWVAEKELRDG